MEFMKPVATSVVLSLVCLGTATGVQAGDCNNWSEYHDIGTSSNVNVNFQVKNRTSSNQISSKIERRNEGSSTTTISTKNPVTPGHEDGETTKKVNDADFTVTIADVTNDDGSVYVCKFGIREDKDSRNFATYTKYRAGEDFICPNTATLESSDLKVSCSRNWSKSKTRWNVHFTVTD